MGFLYILISLCALMYGKNHVLEIIAILSIGFFINAIHVLAHSIEKRSTVQNNQIEKKEDK